jgi:hypothetical protein
MVFSGGDELLHHHLLVSAGHPAIDTLQTPQRRSGRKMPAAMACSLLRTVH